MPSATKYTVEELKRQHKTFPDAKKAYGIKAKGWVALVDKLNRPTYEQLQKQVKDLLAQNNKLSKENASLKQSVSKTKDFDELGFWLLDSNFDRSKFSDFSVPVEAVERESAAKAFYKDLAQTYHPDKGGTEMQMANVSRLYDQLMALVEMNEGLGQ